MNITWIILKREYLNIVKNKTFLISTFLVPLGFAAIFLIQILSAAFVEKESYKVFIRASDVPQIASRLKPGEMLTFEQTDLPEDSLRARVARSTNELFLTISETILDKKSGTAVVVGSKNPSQQAISELKKQLNQAVREYKNEQAGITDTQLAAVEFDLEIKTRKVKEDGAEVQTNVAIATGIGYAVCFLMYMLMGIYGSVLMQGVIEEKSNRIVEVIVSSVKPFDLLLGKVLAIASVGITQFLLWMVLSLTVMTAMAPFMTSVDPQTMAQPGMAPEVDENMVLTIMEEIQQFDWTVLWFFPIYFLGGFFLYGSLLAAAGSAVDNIQDAQQFTFPVTIPMILPLLFVLNIIQNPNGVFAITASLIPFFSPMAMLVRMSLTDVPWYEITLSIAILVASFLGCIWLAARIYRTGILMYGKKPSFKEVFRWVKYRQ
ncbi:MAG: ABC transporter permease [Bacteroidia bacterium]|nr:ABC transporter permease [Bacteroidia bacterium]